MSQDYKDRYGAMDFVINEMRKLSLAEYRNTSPTNRQLLENELGDVRRGIAMLTMASDVSEQRIEDVMAKGPPHKYMHHQN